MSLPSGSLPARKPGSGSPSGAHSLPAIPPLPHSCGAALDQSTTESVLRGARPKSTLTARWSRHYPASRCRRSPSLDRSPDESPHRCSRPVYFVPRRRRRVAARLDSIVWQASLLIKAYFGRRPTARSALDLPRTWLRFLRCRAQCALVLPHCAGCGACVRVDSSTPTHTAACARRSRFS